MKEEQVLSVRSSSRNCHSWMGPEPYIRITGIKGGSHEIVFKVLTNKKRGGLNLVSFDWPPFKLFSLRFSKESVQTPSCERPKTAQRTLFMSWETIIIFK
jgi:hypothetical protein